MVILTLMSGSLTDSRWQQHDAEVVKCFLYVYYQFLPYPRFLAVSFRVIFQYLWRVLEILWTRILFPLDCFDQSLHYL